MKPAPPVTKTCLCLCAFPLSLKGTPAWEKGLPGAEVPARVADFSLLMAVRPKLDSHQKREIRNASRDFSTRKALLPRRSPLERERKGAQTKTGLGDRRCRLHRFSSSRA